MDRFDSPNTLILLEELPPPRERRAAVIIGRFNPPTKGHYALIDKVKAFIRNNRQLNLEVQPIVVVIAGDKTGADKRRNPLTAEQRIKFMQASGNANGVKFLTASNAFAAFVAVREAGFEPIVVVAGPDRADDYIRLLDKHFLDKDGDPIKHVKLVLARDEDATTTAKGAKAAAIDKAIALMKKEGDLDVELVSGSVVRAAVEHDMFPEFMKLTALERKPALARQMFNAIKQAMQE